MVRAALLLLLALPLGCESRCKKTDECRDHARCVWDSDREECVVGTKEDCAASADCRELGLCTLDNNACASTEAGCKSATICKEEGKCAKDGPRCGFGVAADCAASRACARKGACDYSKIFSQCAPTLDEHCAKSEVCKNEKKCVVSAGTCTQEVSGSCGSQCALEGLCTMKDGACVAARDVECMMSSACKLSGLCAAEGGACVARSDRDCRGASACSSDGRCTAQNGKCVAGDDAVQGLERLPPAGRLLRARRRLRARGRRHLRSATRLPVRGPLRVRAGWLRRDRRRGVRALERVQVRRALQRVQG